jgi:hypothetical protein
MYKYFRFFSGFQSVWEILGLKTGPTARLSVEVVPLFGNVYIVENGEKRLLLSGQNASGAAISGDEKRVAIIGSVPNISSHVIHVLDIDGNNHKKFFFDCSMFTSSRVENLSLPDNAKVRVHFECINNAGEMVEATIEKFPIIAAGYYDLILDEHNGLSEIQPFP